MSDNVFEHGEMSPISPTAISRSISPTASPVAASSLISGPTFLYVAPYVLFMLLFFCGFLFAGRIFGCKSVAEGEDNDNDYNDESIWVARFLEEPSTENDGTTHILPTAVGDASVVALGMNDRIRLYLRTFDRNKHFKTLTPQDFLPNHIHCSLDDSDEIESSSEFRCHVETESQADDEEDPLYLYLPLETSESSHQRSLLPPEESNVKDAILKNDAIISCDTSETDSTSTSSETIPLTKIPGTCIICFEKFCAGETVVWSDDTTTCKHVFHEDCMVRYLATNSTNKPGDSLVHRAAGGSYNENPCPTCRQPFCTVRHDDLIMAVLLKSVKVAMGEQEEDDDEENLLISLSRNTNERASASTSQHIIHQHSTLHNINEEGDFI